ncbi:MAG: ATP/GTP-binding protein [Ginsengibacter sp.]
MILKKSAFVVACVLSFSFAKAQKLEKLWETDTILKVPECVVLNAQKNMLYVSNIGSPTMADGFGSIGKIGTDGKVISVDWVTGLNAPKGMALVGNELFVAEPKAVAIIDVKAGKLIARIPVEDAKMLNDVDAAPNGDVYVSDSRGGKIIKVSNRKVSTVVDGLEGPNGVLFAKGKLHFLDRGRLFVMEGNDKKLLAEGMEASTDGVEQLANGDFLVSCWSGVIYYVKANGITTILLDTREQKMNTADITWDGDKKIMYVPTFFKNKVVAYRLL